MSEDETVDVRALLSAIGLSAQRAEAYPPRTLVLDLAEISKIVKEVQEDMERERKKQGG